MGREGGRDRGIREEMKPCRDCNGVKCDACRLARRKPCPECPCSSCAVCGGTGQRSTGIWWVRYHDDRGKEHREKVGSKTAAMEVYRKRKNEVREGKFFPDDLARRRRVTVATVIDRYLEVSLENRSRVTDEWHAGLLKDAFGDEAVDDLRSHDIEKWMRARARETSPSTANRTFGFLMRCCRKAVRDGVVRTDPTARVQKLEEPSGRIRFLSNEEEARLRQAVHTPTDRRKGKMRGAQVKIWPPKEVAWLFVEFAILTGLRRGEQFGLKWECIDFSNRVLTIPRSKNGESRHVPLNSRVIEILSELPSRGKSPWVFVNQKGTAPMDANNFVNRIFRFALDDAGMKNFHWHDLRHTFGSRLVMAGVPLYTVQKLMGHKSIQMTERYAHLAPSHLAEAVEVLVRDPQVQDQSDNGGPSSKPSRAKKEKRQTR